jgi:superfamily II DNA or RNA helicase
MTKNSSALRAEIGPLGCSFTLNDSEGAPVAFSRWNEIEDPSTFGALAILSGMVQSGAALVDQAGRVVDVDSAAVARFDDEIANALALPAPIPYVLDIAAQGRLGTLRLESRWIDSNGLRVRQAARTGCFLDTGNSRYRLATPFFEVLERIDAFNSVEGPSPAQQARDWADIQELIGLEPVQIHPNTFLGRMRVARANRFTLDFVPGEDGNFQIAPVPLVSASISALAPANAEGEDAGSIAASKRLLSSDEQERFQRAFRSRTDVQNQYLGGDDVYVLLSPEVKRSLEVVRRIQRSAPAERLAFARNPFPYLKQSDEDGEPPFSESRSFSDRVTGLGLLEKVTLPWQILGSQGWLPPRTVPIRVGDWSVDLPSVALEPAIVDVELAMSNGRTDVAVGEQTIPATVEVRDALLEARSSLDSQAHSAMAQRNATPRTDTPSARVGLQVTRNLEEAGYAARFNLRSNVTMELPELTSTLKAHQVEAVSWLQRRWCNGKRGALLADDMGLGKSLSALAFMIWLRREMQGSHLSPMPMLIVAPVSLLDNWCNEHERHVGAVPNAFIDIVRAYGSKLPRRATGRDIDTGAAMLDMDRLTVDRFEAPTCVLTTYETLRDYQQSFASIHFSLVVLDEAQRIKNPASLSWHAVSALNSDFWIALTGTPVENRVADLWAIADAIEPGLLGTLRSFSATYEASFDEAALRRLKATIENDEDGAPFMLRRLKEHVLEGIPPKHEHRHALAMPHVQASAYEDIVESANDSVAPKQMLEIVQRLREVSLHPLRPSDCAPEAYIEASARFQSLFKLLDTIQQAQEKVLVFVDRTIVEVYLARLVQQRYHLDKLPGIINGTVPGPKRQSLVDDFQRGTGFDAMILSPKAGGVGLTLTAANHVIHLSRWWNPAVEDQSTDRVYRIGQRKAVHVHYLQATLPSQPGQSFDERLHVLLEKKRGLSRELLWPFENEAGDAATLLGRSP